MWVKFTGDCEFDLRYTGKSQQGLKQERTIICMYFPLITLAAVWRMTCEGDRVEAGRSLGGGSCNWPSENW